jgi:hypothetical protein
MINGIAVYISLCLLFIWFGTTWRKRLVGIGLLTDIGVHVILQLLLGGDGEGRLAVLFGGVMFNLTLMLYRKLRGYSTYTDGQWVNHSGLFYRAQPRPDEGSRRAAGVS